MPSSGIQQAEPCDGTAVLPPGLRLARLAGGGVGGSWWQDAAAALLQRRAAPSSQGLRDPARTQTTAAARSSWRSSRPGGAERAHAGLLPRSVPEDLTPWIQTCVMHYSKYAGWKHMFWNEQAAVGFIAKYDTDFLQVCAGWVGGCVLAGWVGGCRLGGCAGRCSRGVRRPANRVDMQAGAGVGGGGGSGAGGW